MTIPGILTGCAALITAVATLIGALVATGIIQGFVPVAQQPTQSAIVQTERPLSGNASFALSEQPRPTAATATDQQLIIQAIQRANSAEIASRRTQNGSSLPTAFAGAALNYEQVALQNMIGRGEYWDSTLHGQDFQSFDISADGMFADVYVIETWSMVIYSSQTNTCIAQSDLQDVPQTVSLERTGDGWIVTRLIADDGVPQPTFNACY